MKFGLKVKTENASGEFSEAFVHKIYRNYVRSIILRLYLLRFSLQSILCSSSPYPRWV